MPTNTNCTTSTPDEIIASDQYMASNDYEFETDLECDELLAPKEQKNDIFEEEYAPRTRKRAKRSPSKRVPPLDPNGPPVSVYERLNHYGLLRKLTDIVLAKAAVPWNLREDAAQEIHVTWLGLNVKPEFERNQLARYAYMSGQHAALKLRRTLGAVVAIPGALFRTGKDSTFMESIGAAVNPHDVDDYKDSIELSIKNDELGDSIITPSFFEEKMLNISISPIQRDIAYRVLVERTPVDEIADELKISIETVERAIMHITSRLAPRTSPRKSGRVS